jgi:hypothetical protein
MNRHTRFSVLVILSLSSLALHANQLTLTVVNELPISRASETVEMSAEDLASLGNDLQRIRVKDASGRELLCQAVDTDGNHEFDQVIFQSDFGPRESKTFTVTAGAKWQYTKDQFKAYGRFAPMGKRLKPGRKNLCPAARSISGPSARPGW